MPKGLWLSVVLCLGILLTASPALAHRMLVYAFTEGDSVHVESKFVGGGPVQAGEVQVQERSSGKVLVTGTTSDQGKFSFPIPPEVKAGRLDLLIVVSASMGHQGEWLLKAESYLPAQTAAAEAAPAAPESTPAPPSKTETKAAPMDQRMMEEALNKALERQLTPVKEMLTEMSTRRISVSDIVGGLGYIMGIFGLWAYFLSRKPRP
ncbi:MAG: hypothetical protein FJ135_15065 [Deltaproteobacteria bacterium]|nr:hypothetical protein [Deltaproteobacteria bacterium]